MKKYAQKVFEENVLIKHVCAQLCGFIRIVLVFYTLDIIEY